jgi:type II secretory pathway predicted ATPase ExeA
MTSATLAAHHLSLPQARTVITSPLQAATQALENTVRQQGMMCLAADPGVGKTFTLHTWCDQRPDRLSVRLLPRPQARPDDLRHTLYRALDLPGPPPRDPGMCDDHLRHALHQTPRLLAIDEAHQLSASCIEYLRFLYDDPRPRITVVLLASRPRLRALRSLPTLANRVTTWHEMEPLTPGETLTTLPAFHPLWHGIPQSAIGHLDREWAHGNFRRWTTLTHRLLATSRRRPHLPPDPTALLKRMQPA